MKGSLIRFLRCVIRDIFPTIDALLGGDHRAYGHRPPDAVRPPTGPPPKPSDAVAAKLTRVADGAARIGAERQRQIEAEGWTPEHDDAHTLGELAAAGACYALLGTRWKDSTILGTPLVASVLWPWERQSWKPADYPDPPYTADVHIDRKQKDLVRAGALIAAEIDRLERQRRA